MDVMREFPDGYFDLAIVDPPYGIGMAANPVRQAHAPKQWDAAAPDPEYFAELRRVSKHQIVWGANHFIERLPINSACWIVWDKQQPHNFSLAAAELAWTSFSSPCKKFTAQPMQLDRIHPTQKPVKLYDWIFQNYAAPGMRVLDTHMGSGSIAIAAYYAGAHLTACEIDPEYFHAAKARIARETSQTTLNL
jgi:site-specific DNA-methyltransferase (adenine-specific)